MPPKIVLVIIYLLVFVSRSRMQAPGICLIHCCLPQCLTHSRHSVTTCWIKHANHMLSDSIFLSIISSSKSVINKCGHSLIKGGPRGWQGQRWNQWNTPRALRRADLSSLFQDPMLYSLGQVWDPAEHPWITHVYPILPGWPHLQHVTVIVLDAVLPELLEGEHTANAHLVEYLLHNVRERSLPQPGFSIHSEAQQLGKFEAILMCHVGESLQDTFISTFKARVGQDCGHCLVEELPAGVPAEFSHRFPLPPERRDVAGLLVLLQRGELSCLPRSFSISVEPLARLTRGILCSYRVQFHPAATRACLNNPQPSLSSSNYIKSS